MRNCPGFHGKAPARGDFLTRRVPADFLTVWDDWLQTLLTESRRRLGAAWLDAWLQAPVWHFALGPGIAGPGSWLGVLIPSVDRVGRHFPFTILGPCQDRGAEPGAWALRAEALAIGALDDGFDPAQLDTDLAALGPPAWPCFGGDAPTRGWTMRAGDAAWPLLDTDAALPDRESFWWCRSTALVPAALLRTDALPSPADSACLVCGPPDL